MPTTWLAPIFRLPAPGVGEREAAARPIEEPRLQRGLERDDLRADGGLGQVQLLGRTREAHVARGSQEGSQLGEGHHRSWAACPERGRKQPSEPSLTERQAGLSRIKRGPQRAPAVSGLDVPQTSRPPEGDGGATRGARRPRRHMRSLMTTIPTFDWTIELRRS